MAQFLLTKSFAALTNGDLNGQDGWTLYAGDAVTNKITSGEAHCDFIANDTQNSQDHGVNYNKGWLGNVDFSEEVFDLYATIDWKIIDINFADSFQIVLGSLDDGGGNVVANFYIDNDSYQSTFTDTNGGNVVLGEFDRGERGGLYTPAIQVGLRSAWNGTANTLSAIANGQIITQYGNPTQSASTTLIDISAVSEAWFALGTNHAAQVPVVMFLKSLTYATGSASAAVSGKNVILTFESILAGYFDISIDGGVAAVHTSPYTHINGALSHHTYTITRYNTNSDAIGVATVGYALPISDLGLGLGLGL